MTGADDEDPNEAYDVVPFKPNPGGLQMPGWYTCQQNGIDRWHGPRDRMELLAADPAARKAARESKMHHDRKPTPPGDG